MSSNARAASSLVQSASAGRSGPFIGYGWACRPCLPGWPLPQCLRAAGNSRRISVGEARTVSTAATNQAWPLAGSAAASADATSLTDGSPGTPAGDEEDDEDDAEARPLIERAGAPA